MFLIVFFIKKPAKKTPQNSEVFYICSLERIATMSQIIDRIPACWYSEDNKNSVSKNNNQKPKLIQRQCYCTVCGSPVNPHKPKHEHYIHGGNCACRVFEEM